LGALEGAGFAATDQDSRVGFVRCAMRVAPWISEMKLRLLVVALLLANIGFYAWSRGGLALFGTEPDRFAESEPQRLQQQVRPQLLVIRPGEPIKP